MSAAPDVAKLLRPGVLDGIAVLLAGASARGPERADAALAPAVGAACAELGARVITWRSDDPVPDGVDVLVVDGAATFAAACAGHGDRDGDASASARVALRECLDGAWQASHAVANAAFIDARRPGQIVYLAPPSAPAGAAGAAEHADAARAGLENLARTLSIEWARRGVTTVAIAPGAQTTAAEVAGLCAYVASPAGEYFSGCLLDLRGV